MSIELFNHVPQQSVAHNPISPGPVGVAAWDLA